MLKRTRRKSWKRNLILTFALLAAGKGWCADSSNANTSADDPLLDLFIKKGYVTQQEADDIRTELQSQQTNGVPNANNFPKPATAWSVVPGIKNMELFGDIRMRYEYRSAEDPSGGKIELNRLRFAARFGLRGDASDNFYYGLRIETSQNPRSPWVTMGTQSGTSTPYQLPYGKSASTIALGQVYLGWHWDDYVNVTVGAMPNYLYTTPMVWDNDLNPMGAFERFKYTVGQADFFATFGQFIYQDTNPTGTSPGYFNFDTSQISNLPFLLAWQGGVNYHLTKTANFKVAPVIYQYTGLHDEGTPANGGVGADFDGTYVGQGATAGPSTGPGSQPLVVPAYYNLAGNTPGFDVFYANQTG